MRDSNPDIAAARIVPNFQPVDDRWKTEAPAVVGDFVTRLMRACERHESLNLRAIVSFLAGVASVAATIQIGPLYARLNRPSHEVWIATGASGFLTISVSLFMISMISRLKSSRHDVLLLAAKLETITRWLSQFIEHGRMTDWERMTFDLVRVEAESVISRARETVKLPLILSRFARGVLR